MTMSEVEPTWLLSGVPERTPVAVLNDAQLGLFVILNVSVSPSLSEPVGVNV